MTQAKYYIGAIKLTKVYDGFYVGIYITKDEKPFDIFVEKMKSGLYKSECKQHDCIAVSKSIKGAVSRTEYLLKTWGY